MVLVLWHGNRWGESNSDKQKKHTTPGMYVFPHESRDVFQYATIPFPTKNNHPLPIIPITSGRASAFQSSMRERQRQLSSPAGKTSQPLQPIPREGTAMEQWSVAWLGRSFITMATSSSPPPQRTAALTPAGQEAQCHTLKSPSLKTKQNNPEESETLWLSQMLDEIICSSQTSSLLRTFSFRLCFKSLWGTCSIWLKYPSGLILLSQTGGSPVFLAFISPFKQLWTNLELHIPPPHRISSWPQSRPILCGGASHQSSKAVPKPPTSSQVWGKTKPRL